MFELAVLDLKEMEALEKASLPDPEAEGAAISAIVMQDRPLLAKWTESLKSASDKLDQAMALSTSTTDLSSRLDSRVAMLRGEIGYKKEFLGLV